MCPAPAISRRKVDVQIVDRPVVFAPLEPFPPASGAECIFLGRTRAESHPEHGALARLRYEGYRPMAERELTRLAEEAAARFDASAIRIHHALGPVAVGEASVLVQVACGHRAASFTACRYVIDALKTRVPIWKREEWTAGATWSAGTPVGEEPA